MEIKNHLFTTEEAAVYLGVSTGTLENWRSGKFKTGPVYHKPKGKVYYFQSDLDEWIKSGSAQ